MTPYSADSYASEGSTSCTACITTYPNCATCNSAECLTCKSGYKLKDNVCIVASGSQVFTTAGEHSFTVPEGIEELTVTLVSGRAGGGGGAAPIAKTATFVTTGTGSSANDENNAFYVESDGVITWTIPKSVRGRNVIVDACGGGGGGAYREDITNANCKAGGSGGIINNVSVPMPDEEIIDIIIGGYGARGGKAQGGCAYGGGGALVDTNARARACGAPSGTLWGAGGYRVADWDQDRPGRGGYDPVFSNHASGGGSNGGNGGHGSKVGGGGGGYGGWYSALGGGGGGATIFWDVTLVNTQEYVALGGDGGSCSAWGGTGGNGSGSAGTAGTGSGTNIFGGSYCSGGAVKANGKPGAMRISYEEYVNGGTGGGAGHIVPKQKISVSEGQVLTITVGAAGGAGAIGYVKISWGD